MLSKIITAMRRAMPEATFMPLFSTKDGLRPAFNCYKKDWSQLDWDAPYEDSGPTGTFSRDVEWYACQGANKPNHGYVIVDVDNKNGHTVDASIDLLIEQGLNTNTFTVRTKSGGLHLYYCAPAYLVKTMANYLPGVDIRGKGGYVVAPGGMDYQVILDVPPAELNIALPKAGDSPKLPTLTDMQISVPVNYESMDIIPLGQRDQALLALSGRWYQLPDSEIAAKFSKLTFETAVNDVIELHHLMAKVDRDRAKNSANSLDVATYLLARFAYVMESDLIYDLHNNVAKNVQDMMNFYPATIMVPRGDRSVALPHIRFWLTHPQRRTVKSTRFKPCAPAIFNVKGMEYINTYEAPQIKPWVEPVTAEDPELHEFMQVVDLITNYDPLVKDYYLSQRAAKLQDPAWTPAWGFVLISQHEQVGKDATAHIFGVLLGERYCRTIKKFDLLNDRQEYNHEKLFVVLNEPGGLQRGGKGLESVEMLKEFMSSKKGTSRRLYQNTSDEVPIYKIPEIHSNIADSFEIGEDHSRYAPILITGKPLPAAVYNKLRARQQDEDNGCSFYRKLLRFFLDYTVNSDIQESRPPLMPDHHAARTASRGEDYHDLIDAMEHGVGLFSSPLQTCQSLDLAISLLLPSERNPAKWRRKLIKEGAIKEYGRVRGIPLIEYDKNNISSEAARISKIPTDKNKMVVIYYIREFSPGKGTVQSVVDANFFT